MYICTSCGNELAKWSGQCPVCSNWNTLKEIDRFIKKTKKSAKKSIETSLAIPLSQLTSDHTTRLQTGIGELDGVLGGGIVPGMVTLIGGEPGVGKSTLMLHLAAHLAAKDYPILYLSGEESNEQIKLRSQRLGIDADNIYLLASVEAESVISHIAQLEPQVLIIDSIQSVKIAGLDNAPGSISQLRECTAFFTRLAKKINLPIFLIGHVTKDGMVAGPKIIEHMVDTVLYFEGELQRQLKILRATKNRFGSTNEIGIFEMTQAGLQEVKNPGGLFLENDEDAIGTAVGAVVEGSRAFLVEVQALVTPAGYGTPQRVAIGMDQKRLALLLAIIEKNLAINLRNSDVFINIAGGIKVLDTSLDLAVISAVLSSLNNFALPQNTLLLGEIGLSGEIRNVSQADKRCKEAEKMGYAKIIISTKDKYDSKALAIKKISHIGELNSELFKKKDKNTIAKNS